MAGTRGRSPAPLEEQGANPVLQDALEHPTQYSFVQLVRLLRQHCCEMPTEGGGFACDKLRFRPPLSLGFPATDVAALEELPRDEDTPDSPEYRISAAFLGLYGPSSPLPTFYTEDLMDEADTTSVNRDFLDIFNNGFFLAYLRVWSRHRLSVKLNEEHDEATKERLYCLTGLGHESLRQDFDDPWRMVRLVGLLSQFPRSMSGLRSLLRELAGNVPVDVTPNVARVVRIPDDQRLHLGMQANRLGSDARLGGYAGDRMGAIDVALGPLTAKRFLDLVPGSGHFSELVRTIRFYCTEPLDVSMTFHLKAGEARSIGLGGSHWARLGVDTWLLTPAEHSDQKQTPPVSTTFGHAFTSAMATGIHH